MPYGKKISCLPASLLIMIIICTPALTFAQKPVTADTAKKENPEDLQNFTEDIMNEISFYSLEELLNTSISSISKKKEPFMDAASSIYIVTDEDIRRSASTRLIEVLGMVPGFSYQEQTYTTPMYGCRKYYDVFPQTVLMLVDIVDKK